MQEIIFGVLGGLALFIYGMNLMSEGLKKVAGDRMRRILEAVTKNPLIAVVVGAAVTAILQSSSATTVMVIGFVNAGLMNLQQAIGVIMGANIGTTMTAQLIAFQIGHYAYPIAALGFALYFFNKWKRVKHFGQVLFGFGVLFIGLNIMSDVLKPLANDPTTLNLITTMSKRPAWGLLTGTVLTIIIQSSSAVIGVLQSLASQPVAMDGTVRALIPLAGAVPILLGSNIGTTITAALASIGTNNAAKRTALSHTLFNVCGTILCLLSFPLFISFVYRISPMPNPALGVTEAGVISRQIANAHTAFNLLNTLVWLPFVKYLAVMVTRIIPKEDVQEERAIKYLDEHVLNNAEVALDLSAKELRRMGTFSQQMLSEVENFIIPGSKLLDREKLEQNEEILDFLQTEIIHYLSTITSRSSLTVRQSNILANLIHITGDLERIGDHCTNIMELEMIMEEEKIVFSDLAQQDLEKIFHFTAEMFDLCLTALEKRDLTAARQVLEMEGTMDILEEEARNNHLERRTTGYCNPRAAVVFNELMLNLERIADHCNNIAEAVVDRELEVG
ncbi:MAG: Na/Pi cotransporter family protein [Firmicutes bacterium]|nr:Na/Pi cotransporter family protein [Bacillota bacterium]